MQSFKAAQIDGSEERDVKVSIAGQPVTVQGPAVPAPFVLPNFYFHVTIAYAILRHNGVELGKRDFVGAVPGMAEGGGDTGRGRGAQDGAVPWRRWGRHQPDRRLWSAASRA